MTFGTVFMEGKDKVGFYCRSCEQVVPVTMDELRGILSEELRCPNCGKGRYAIKVPDDGD